MIEQEFQDCLDEIANHVPINAFMRETQKRIIARLKRVASLEIVAEAVHDAWWEEARAQGRTDHPDMIPYADLPEHVKEYDRVTARAVMGAIDRLLIDV